MRIISSINLVYRQASQKPVLLGLLVPLFLFLLARNYAKSHYYRDPTSTFFDPSRAYEQRYSTVRRHEANAFVNISATKSFRCSTKGPPLLCVGMLTIARPSGDVYFRTSVGSLLAGLTPERNHAEHSRDCLLISSSIVHQNFSI